MLYGYKFSLLQMTQIKNWKKKNTFDHILLGIDELPLETFEVKSQIGYKTTVPLNMFEKYAIRLIQRSEEIHSSIKMNIGQIAKLLHLDERLVGENLDNLAAIGMLNGLDSDIITINSDENAEYLQYENKFKKEHMTKVYHLTKNEYENIGSYVQNVFEKDSENRSKKFSSIDILNQEESVKNVHLLHYSDNKFLIYSNDGINSQNDLKFLDQNTFGHSEKRQDVPSNMVCHYDEFLPLLKDRLQKNRDDLVVIGSHEIDKSNLFILPKKNIEDIYILSDSIETHKRIFQIYLNDFLWIGDDLYQKNGEFVIQHIDRGFKIEIKEKLSNYFLMQIQDVFPEYDNSKIARIDEEIQVLELQIDKIKTKKETDLEIQKLNTEKNKLYGIESNNTKKRSELRKNIDKLEEDNNQHALEKYPIYLKNRKTIFSYQTQVTDLKNQIEQRDLITKKINVLKNERGRLLPKEIKQRIAPIEKELKNLERLKI